MKTVAGIRIRNQTAVKENGERKDGRQMTILNQLKERNRSAGKQEFSLAKLESELKMLRSNILKNFVKKQVYRPSDRKQKTPVQRSTNITEFDKQNESRKFTSPENPDKYSANNIINYKNGKYFTFSTPIYNFIDSVQSNRTVSNSSASSVNDEQLNTVSKPETLKGNILIPQSDTSYSDKNNKISSSNSSPDSDVSQIPSLISASVGHVSVAQSDDGTSLSNRSESNATETNLKTSSESVSTRHTSCDSCLVTSSSTYEDEEEDEEEDEDQEACLDESFPQSVPHDTTQRMTIDCDEDVPSSGAGDDSESAMESILIRTASMNFNDKDGVESSTKRKSAPSDETIRKWLPVLVKTQEWISNYDDLIKALISTRALNIPNNQSQDLNSISTNNDIQIEPISLRQRNNHLRNSDNTTENQKKQLPDDVELEKLSTNQVLAQIGLSVLARERPIEMLMSSPKKSYSEAYRKILTLCGYGS
ncbi:hypothetical protein CEXT_275981 [Caerostris extrusa]|uniref:Uncharacterized protein n=1 Tax=Caerostris extrusa TaxID=172846 RepID=A0AAV4SLF7_CAEEX|nr:hypothetical protein CEXT_275981 [Caerostris extrusa]